MPKNDHHDQEIGRSAQPSQDLGGNYHYNDDCDDTYELDDLIIRQLCDYAGSDDDDKPMLPKEWLPTYSASPLPPENINIPDKVDQR